MPRPVIPQSHTLLPAPAPERPPPPFCSGPPLAHCPWLLFQVLYEIFYHRPPPELTAHTHTTLIITRPHTSCCLHPLARFRGLPGPEPPHRCPIKVPSRRGQAYLGEPREGFLEETPFKFKKNRNRKLQVNREASSGGLRRAMCGKQREGAGKCLRTSVFREPQG